MTTVLTVLCCAVLALGGLLMALRGAGKTPPNGRNLKIVLGVCYALIAVASLTLIVLVITG